MSYLRLREFISSTVFNFKFIAECPIYELCMETGRLSGTGNRCYWWKQKMDLPEEEVSPANATGEDALDFKQSEPGG